jgi:hypothetical protein
VPGATVRRDGAHPSPMWGCLIAGLLILLLFVLVPPLLWPFLLIAVILLGVLAAVFGVFRGIGRWFSR